VAVWLIPCGVMCGCGVVAVAGEAHGHVAGNT